MYVLIINPEQRMANSIGNGMFERWRKSGTYVHGGGGGRALDANFLVAGAPLLRVAPLCVFELQLH